MEGLDLKKLNEKQYIETKSVVRHRELVPDYFIKFLNLGFFMKNKSIWWPQYKKVAEAYAQIFINPKVRNYFFRKALKKLIS